MIFKPKNSLVKNFKQNRMKKLILITFTVSVLISCQSDSDIVKSDPNALQRVDFYPKSPNETRWNFNKKGFLISITDPNGDTLESFAYDAKNNVIENTKYSQGAPIENLNIIYDSENYIKSINNKIYNYSYEDNRYFYNSNNESFSCEVNSDGLATLYFASTTNTNPAENIFLSYTFEYDNGNLISIDKAGSVINPIEIDFNYGLLTNPLKNGLLPVFKLKSLTEPQFLEHGFTSNNLKEGQNYLDASQKSQTFGMLFNNANKLELITEEDYYQGVYNSGRTNSFYYYQGDVIP